METIKENIVMIILTILAMLYIGFITNICWNYWINISLTINDVPLICVMSR